MKRKIIITTPNLKSSGGVSSYWGSLFPEMQIYYNDISILEIGGNGKNILGPFKDQLDFRNKLKEGVALAFLNPSLGMRSFIRDGLFAKQLIKRNVPFIVFFHGWDLNFEKKVDNRYMKFFKGSFGKAKKIFVLSTDFKTKIIEWGYKGEVILETTNVDSSLIENFSIENKLKEIRTLKKIEFLFLARLVRQKGVFEVVDAFKNLNVKYPNIGLTIAGDGSDLHELKKHVKDHINIEITGRIEGDQKMDILKKCHIFCLPTYYGEGLPTSILEAMIFGMPIVTTNMGGLKKFFKEEEMGYLVEPKNPLQLEDTLEKLMLDMNKRVEMGKFNNDYANKNLTNLVVANRISGHIMAVLNENQYKEND